MILQEAAPILSEIAESDYFYVRCDPEIPDFTTEQEFKLLVSGGKKKLEIEVNPSNIRTFIGMLEETIFQPKKHVFAWNIKPFFTYFTFFVKRTISLDCNLYDLKVIESFLGIFEQNAPNSLSETVNRFKQVCNYKSWKSIYQKIHLPLILKTLPKIESTSIHNNAERTGNFAYYEIEGQKNGRLLSYGKYNRSYLPHNMGHDKKNDLRPTGVDDFFMVADINNCEVTVLQVLSGDKRLKDYLNSGRDVYIQIYEALTGDQCDTDKKRKICKSVFLPVIYGCGKYGLSKNTGFPENVCLDLIDRVYRLFPEATEWITNQEKEAKEKGILEDYFGRPRKYTSEDYYRSRNMVVQGPAATICLEKLILIEDKISEIGSKVLFTVHDGYGITCNLKQAKETFTVVKEVIEAESTICPDLFLGMHAQFGKNLNNLKTFWK